MVLVLELQRHVHFNLVVYAEALFVNDVGRKSGSAVSVYCSGDDFFIFRKRLFRDKGAWQVEFATRPMLVVTESPQVGDQVIDLVRRQQFAESRHDFREAT